jgi:hypothetical protein
MLSRRYDSCSIHFASNQQNFLYVLLMKKNPTLANLVVSK